MSSDTSAICQSIDTALIHAGTERVLGAAVMPIFQSVSFAETDSTHKHKPTPTNLYSRPADTPNHKARPSFATTAMALCGISVDLGKADTPHQ
jgi:O-acetylhomoserine/O-acetylserine sulfhydrylase-like pyridoxal-dependent enzyme